MTPDEVIEKIRELTFGEDYHYRIAAAGRWLFKHADEVVDAINASEASK